MKKTKKLYLTTAIIVLIMAGFTAIKIYDWQKGKRAPQNSNQELQDNALRKDSVDASKAVKNPSTNSTPGTEGSPRVEISLLSQSNEQIIIQTKLYGVVSGSCNLSATHEDMSILKNAPVIYQSDFSTCGGFSIPVTEFAQKGDWQFAIEVKLQDNKSVSTSKNLTIN